MSAQDTRAKGLEQSAGRVMAELVTLALSSTEYADVVEALLDSVEGLLDSPFISLAIQEVDEIGFHVRVAANADRAWAAELSRAVEELQRGQLQRLRSGAKHGGASRPGLLPAWTMSFPAKSRSGRSLILTIAAMQPIDFPKADMEAIARLTQHSLLVLDHALLLAQLESMETEDRLTGVANHRRLLETLDYEMARHRHLGRPLSLLVLDVDGLEGINRSYGHGYGDHILSKLAALLKETVRPIDVIARCGMDEFAILLPETDEEEAETLAQRLSERLLEVRFAGGSIDLTVGAAQVKPWETLSAESFLQRGEQALYEAKRQEREQSERVAGLRRAVTTD